MADELDSEWLEALEAPKDDIPNDEPADDTPVDGKEGGNEEKDDTSNDDTPVGDTADGDADDDTNSDDEPAAITKETIKEAIQEVETAKATKATYFDTLKKEVTETLYPEGIDRQLRDSDGDPITGIDDLTKLVNPKTGELFTDEEAGAWLLSAQQKLNKEIEQVEQFVEQVAETNIAITEGAERVAQKYQDILAADDKLRERLVKAFDKTLIKDPKTGVTINAPVDVEEFFDLALESKMESFIEQQKQAEAKAKEDAKKAQAERGDLIPKGQSDNLNPEDKEWAEAYKAYEKGV